MQERASTRVIADGAIESLPGVRNAIRSVLDRWRIERRRLDVVLVVDEMVTNVGQHVGGEVVIDLRRDGATLQVTVADGDPDFRTHGRRHGTDRFGLRIIDSAADRWGVEPIAEPGRGKLVWAEFDLDDDPGSGLRDPRPATVTVES